MRHSSDKLLNLFISVFELYFVLTLLRRELRIKTQCFIKIRLFKMTAKELAYLNKALTSLYLNNMAINRSRGPIAYQEE